MAKALPRNQLEIGVSFGLRCSRCLFLVAHVFFDISWTSQLPL